MLLLQSRNEFRQAPSSGTGLKLQTLQFLLMIGDMNVLVVVIRRLIILIIIVNAVKHWIGVMWNEL